VLVIRPGVVKMGAGIASTSLRSMFLLALLLLVTVAAVGKHLHARMLAAGLCWHEPHHDYVGCRAWALDSLLVGISPESLAGTLAAMEDQQHGVSDDTADDDDEVAEL
jgi:hypothetical protein